jgi:hypothetical protein
MSVSFSNERKFLTKRLYALTDGGHGLGRTLVVEAVVAVGRCNPHGLAQPVEDRRAPTKLLYRLAEHRVIADVGYFHGKLPDGLLVVGCVFVEKRIEQLRQTAVEVEQSLGKVEERTVEGKAVAIPTVLAVQGPEGERVGGGHGRDPAILQEGAILNGLCQHSA